MRQSCFLLPLALAACATTAPEAAPADPVPPAAAAVCRPAGLPAFVGQPRSEAIAARILADSGARTIRWVEKDMMVTMDFRDDRVTAYLDAANRIERIACG